MTNKPNIRNRWRDTRPSKMMTFWLCLASVAVVLFLGFNWGGWMTGGAAQKQAQTMAQSAVIERLAPICVAQFNLDPTNTQMLEELNGMSSFDRTQFVQEQGWATISGEEKPDRQVVNACTKLLLEMSP